MPNPRYGRQFKLPRWQRRKGYRVVTRDDVAVVIGDPRRFAYALRVLLRHREWRMAWQAATEFARCFWRWAAIRWHERKHGETA